ncbi:2-oxoglutarate (2OG) and Fe(II)-dependent oxygenase superfamily protein [Wolffia australiana]
MTLIRYPVSDPIPIIGSDARKSIKFLGQRDGTASLPVEKRSVGERKSRLYFSLSIGEARMGGEDGGKTKKKRIAAGEASIGGRRWPMIGPKPDLQVNHLKGHSLFTVPNYLNPNEAKGFIEAAECSGFSHQGSLGPARGEAFRDNDRISFNDAGLAKCIWESGLDRVFAGIKLQGKSAVGLNPNIRFYRYKVGQRFGRHIDESVDLGGGQRTKYTLLIYLAGAGPQPRQGADHSAAAMVLAGGETVFYDDHRGIVAQVAPVEGMALLHVHGGRCMLHEARAVIKGTKYVLRSDVVFA